MSWLSDFLSTLKPSSREEHFWAKIAGEEELENDTIPSSREEGFMYKIAQKIQGGSLPDASEASEGDVLTIDDGEPVWAAGGGGSGGGVFVVNITGDSPSNAAFDKTASEVFAAKQTMPVVVTMTFNGATAWGDLVLAANQGTNYTFLAYFGSSDLSQFGADSDDGYPTMVP